MKEWLSNVIAFFALLVSIVGFATSVRSCTLSSQTLVVSSRPYLDLIPQAFVEEPHNPDRGREQPVNVYFEAIRNGEMLRLKTQFLIKNLGHSPAKNIQIETRLHRLTLSRYEKPVPLGEPKWVPVRQDPLSLGPEGEQIQTIFLSESISAEKNQKYCEEIYSPERADYSFAIRVRYKTDLAPTKEYMTQYTFNKYKPTNDKPIRTELRFD